MRHGAVVGEVIVTGPSGQLPDIDIAALAARQAAQIRAVTPTGMTGLTFYPGRAGDRQLVSEVWLLHGSSVDRAYVVAIGNGSPAEEKQYRATVTALAKQWSPRLDDVLGNE